MVSKELGYELTKIVPLDVIEKSRNPDYPNDLIDVGRKLKASHLPPWLVYAIEESDHSISNLDMKIPRYISDEVICEVAEDYVSKENPVINLARPGEYDWMQDDPMKPHREQFDTQYNTAVSAIQTVLDDVFGEWNSEFVTDFGEQIAKDIVDYVDMFSWEIYRQEINKEDSVDNYVAEMIVNNIHPHDFAIFYLIENTDITEYETLLSELQTVSEEISDCLENEELYTPSSGIIIKSMLLFDEQQEKLSNLRDEMKSNR